jgi:hypothetical protein
VPPSRSSPTPIPTATSAASRCGYRAGARIEGGLDLLAPRSFRARSLPGALRYILTGRTRLPILVLRDQDRIEIRSVEPLPRQLDGEDVGDVTEVVLEAERGAVDVLGA